MNAMFRGIVFSYFLSQFIQIELVYATPTEDVASDLQTHEMQSQQLLTPQINVPQANKPQTSSTQASDPLTSSTQTNTPQTSSTQTNPPQVNAANSPVEINITSENLKNIFKHLTRRIEKNGQISGFHIYDSSAKVIELPGNFNLVKISHIESLLIPKTMDQKAFHGGYLIKNRKNFGWKSFFPVDWDLEKISQYLIHTNQNHLNTQQPINKNATLFRHELAPVQGLYPIPSILIYDNSQKVIKTLYPKISPVPIQDSELLAAVGPHSSRVASADAQTTSIRSEKFDPQLSEKLNLILEDYDIDGLQELKEKEPAQTSRVLKSLLLEAVSSLDRDAIEKLLYWAEVEVDQTHFFRILKKIKPAPVVVETKSGSKTKLGAAEEEKARARDDEAHAHAYIHSRAQATQVLIAQILLQAFKGLNESLIDEVLNSENQALVQAVLAECIASKNERLCRYVRERKMSKIKKLYRGLTGFLYVMFEKPNKTPLEYKDQELEPSAEPITTQTQAQANLDEGKSQPIISPVSSVNVKNNSLSDDEKSKIRHAMLEWDGTKEKNPSNEILDLFFRLSAEESKEILLPLLSRLKKDRPYIGRQLLKRKKAETLAMLKSWSQMGDDFQACKTWFILNPDSLEDWLIQYRKEISDKNLFDILSNSGTMSLLQSIHHHLSQNSKTFPESYRFVNEQILKEKASALVSSSGRSTSSSGSQSTKSEDLLEDSELILHNKLKSALLWGKPGFSNPANNKTLIDQIKSLLHRTSFDAKPAGSDSSCKDLAKKILEEKRTFLSQSLKSHLTLVKNKEKKADIIPAAEHLKENTQENSKKLSQENISENLIHSNFLENDSEALLNKGLEYYRGEEDQRDYAKAFHYFTQALNLGDAVARYPLGEMHYLGRGIKRNYPKAFELLLPLAQGGHAESNMYLGEMYFFGRLGERNYPKAAEHFKMALKDDKFNDREMIELYLQLMNTDNRAEKILDFYTRLAQKDDILAQFFLSEMYFYGLGVERDYNQAISWLMKTKDSAVAHPDYKRRILGQVQYYVGEMLLYGLGSVPRSIDGAIKWFSDSLENEHAGAAVYLGRFAQYARLDKTINFKSNLRPEDEYFNYAAKLGEPRAFYYNAVLFKQRAMNYRVELERISKEFSEKKNELSVQALQAETNQLFERTKNLKAKSDWCFDNSDKLLVQAETMGFEARKDSLHLDSYDDRIPVKMILRAKFNFSFAISNPNGSLQEFYAKIKYRHQEENIQKEDH